MSCCCDPYSSGGGSVGTFAFDAIPRTPSAEVNFAGIFMQGMKFVAPLNMTVAELGVFLTNTSPTNEFLVGIYDESFNLVGQCDAIPATVAGYQRGAVSVPFDLVGGVEYWAAVRDLDGSSNLAYVNCPLQNILSVGYQNVGAGGLPASIAFDGSSWEAVIVTVVGTVIQT